MQLDFTYHTPEQNQNNAEEFHQHIAKRRTVRDFAETAIPPGVIESCLLAAGTAPNGANLQPWHFAVAQSPKIKAAIRQAAEAEEKEFYDNRAPKEWLDALSHLGTDADKPFLETAPALIAIFQKSREIDHQGNLSKTYYPKESVGIATGILITALHTAGLATLTHTPSPMNFLNQIFERPKDEKPFLLLVVGYPAKDCQVPDNTKKSLSEIATFH